MALNTCDEHDDVMVVWSFGRDCPLCRANTAIESLNDQLEKALEKARDIQDQLKESEQRLSEMPDPE